MKFKKFKKSAVLLVAGVMILTAASCDDSEAKQSSQKRNQKITEEYQQAADKAVPYPKAEMKKGGFLERRLLKENLLRQNDANRIAYVTLLNQMGQPILQFTIQGMVFDLNSQMTTPNQVLDWCGANCTSYQVTEAPGDNGTWGPEPNAIGFFTTEGVEIKWNGLYIESDSPLDLTTKPLIIYDASSAKPSVTAGGVSSKTDGGIK